MRRLLIGLIGLCLSALTSAPRTYAADRALIIGIGDYINPDARLPGIDKDVAQATDIATRLGFSKPQVLADRDATRRGILNALKANLVEGVTAADRVFVYYSGHGASAYDLSSDEDDKKDEALLAADFEVTSDGNGGKILRGMILDDEIGALLAQSPSRNILLIVDACHSGTVDRSIRLAKPLVGEVKGVAKAYPIPGVVKADRSFGPVARTGGAAAASGGGAGNYVALNASGDEEQAIATENGSAFTVGLAEAIRRHAADPSITPVEMVKIAKEYVASALSSTQRFTPQIQGSPELRNQPIALTNTLNGGGPNWRRVEALGQGLPGLSVANVQPRYRDGDKLEIEVDVAQGGYLNVINVGPDDNLILLFPNRFNPNNKVEPGKLRLPTPQMTFDLTAQAPFGRSLILAILTEDPIDLRKSATDSAQSPTLASPALGSIASLTQNVNSSRSFAPTARSDARAWAAIAETQVCRTSQSCE